MAQKMVATLEFAMPDGDVFEITDKARGARTIMEQAVTEIKKTFPDAKVTFTTARIVATGTGRRGRRPNAEKEAEAKAAEASANGADTSNPAAPTGNRPAPAAQPRT